MATNNEFIMDRAVKSLAVQTSITATWQWPDKTLAEWAADIAALEDQKEAVADADAAKELAQGGLGVNFELLHSRTRQGLSMLKNHFRDDQTVTDALRMLKADGTGRDSISREALAYESAWELYAVAWEPMAGQTVALFKAMREAYVAQLKSYSTSTTALGKANGIYNKLARALSKDCVAWYSDATHVFAEGTVEGDLIRTVPTTYTPPGGPLPGQATISAALAIEGSGYHLDFELAEGADSFEVWGKAPGATEFSIIDGENVAATYEATGQSLGEWQFLVYARNASGRGPASEMASITVV